METSTAIDRFEQLVAGDGPLDLAECALTAAAAMRPETDVERWLDRLTELAAEASFRVAHAESPLGQINALNARLFDDLGFAGNVDDYYDPRNSLLDAVIERRLGIPITLSLLYVEVAKRLGVPMVGVGMPGHFLVRHVEEESMYVDPYNRGVILSEAECIEQFKRINQGMHWDPAFLAPVSDRSLLARMLRNLGAIWTQRAELRQAERVLTMLLALQPNEAGHRRDRGMLRFRLGEREEALVDLERYIDPSVSAPDAWYVRRLIERIKNETD
jgi:regulator of sirC expression with transglutaminase-like and TPR domain